MFNNIGKKIKVLTKVVCWIGIIGSIILGIVVIADAHRDDEELIGIAILIGGPLLFWLGSFLMYGFGELVDKTASIEAMMRNESTQKPVKKNDRGTELKNLLNKGLISEEEYREKMKNA